MFTALRITQVSLIILISLILVGLLGVGADAHAKGTGTKSASGPQGAAAAPNRASKQRTLNITDANLQEVQELHVQAGTPTTVALDQPLKEGGLLVVDVKGAFFPAKTAGQSVILVPRRDLASSEVVTLKVLMLDNTELAFKLVTIPDEMDLQVNVHLALDKKASGDSIKALREQIANLQTRLDDAQSQAGDQGIKKMGMLILSQDLEKPASYSVERRSLHWIDKQSRLLVEAKVTYRLFNQEYLVLTVQNRDTKNWVLDKAELQLTGGTTDSDVKVIDAILDASPLTPDETAKLVVIFAIPAQEKRQKFDVKLLEKNGNRHVTLDGLEL